MEFLALLLLWKLRERCCGVFGSSSAVEIAGALLWSFCLVFCCGNRGGIAVVFRGGCGKLCLWKLLERCCGILPPSSAVEIAGALLWSFAYSFAVEIAGALL